MEAVLEPEHAPFNYACQNPKSTVGRPQTGLFKREVPETDGNGNTSRAFLKIVEAKIRQKIDENRNMAKAISNCAKSNESQCREIRSWVETALPEFVGQARFHLSLAQSHFETKTWVNLTSTFVNTNLNPLGTPKFRSWSRLSPEERIVAEKRMEKYIGEIKAEQPNASESERLETLLVLRYQHFEQYHAMMSQLPFLQYISSEKPKPQEVLAAVKELENNIALEEKELDKITQALEKNPMDPKALTLLKYTTQVEEALLENSKYCAIATSLAFTLDNRELGNILGLSLPILAVSIAAPPVAGVLGASTAMGTGISVGAGAILGAGFIYDSQKYLDQERVRSFSQFYGGPENLESERVRLAESERNFQIITFPLNFVGSGIGIAARRAMVKSDAIKTASKIKLASKPKN